MKPSQTKSEGIMDDSRFCPKCLDLIIKIRRGEITGAVLSCHPLEELADVELKPYIESRKMKDG